MKMKFTLLAAAVALFGLNAGAQAFLKIMEPTEDLTKILTLSNSTKVEANKKLPGLAIQGSTDHKNLLIPGAEFKDNIYGKYGPDEKTIGVYADGSKEFIRFRYNAGNKGRNGESRQLNAVTKHVPEGYNEGYVKFVVGPKAEGAASDQLVPRLEFVSAKDAANADATYTMTFAFEPVTLTEETQEFELDFTGVSGDYFAEDGSVKPFKIAYVDFYVDGVAPGQFVAFEKFGVANRSIPKVGFDTQSTRSLGFWGEQEVLPGTIFIQAEDFDEMREGEDPTFAGYSLGMGDQWTDGYGYPNRPGTSSHWYATDLSKVRIDNANNKCGGAGIWQMNPGNFSSKNDAPSGFALCGMSKVDGGWGTQYGGEYLDETSNKISLEQAIDGFGTWFEYTFEMEENGYVDISLAATSHAAFYPGVIQGGTRATGGEYTTAYNKPREEGGYVVEGLDDDFLKLYGFCYILSFDGKEQLTNWEGRGMPNPKTGALDPLAYVNPFEWTSTQQDDGNGNLVNSKFLPITPPYPFHNGGQQWHPLYRSDVLGRMMIETYDDGAGNQLEYDFKKKCDELTAENGEDYFEKNFKHRPDYIDIPCSAGKHTIRVQSTGGATVFDEIRITAHKELRNPSSGVENIAAKRVADEFEGEPEYFDLQGRKVMTPANGLYIVKRGNTVTKEVIR